MSRNSADNVTSIYTVLSGCEISSAEDCGECSSAGLDIALTIHCTPRQITVDHFDNFFVLLENSVALC